ncbi:MAG: helix-turn-helix transcriptional regulator [Candidatus Heimdallarchaeota archaeon]|nr:helix-turn-helix transcriptional regulator [Candidatus Heimdallarchaeota archaeon]
MPSSSISFTTVPGIDEDVLFTILAHPLRRKILKELHSNNTLSFTDMNSWGIKPGTLYFHIKELNNMIVQNSDKKYTLTELGLEVCTWMLGKNGRVTVTKIDAFTLFVQPFYPSFKDSVILKVILVMLSIFSTIFSSRIDAVILGPFIFPLDELSFMTSLVLNLISFIIELAIILVILWFFGLKTIRFSYLVIYLMFSNSITYLGIIILVFLPFSISISPIFWIIFVSVSQIFAILVLSAS